MSEMTYYHVHSQHLEIFFRRLLEARGARSDVAHHVAEGLVQTSLRGVDSHGIRLLPHYLNALNGGRINPDPRYRFEKTAAATGRMDGDHTFGHAAGSAGMNHAVELAEEAGAGIVAVYNSSHFGAAAYYALQASKRGYIGFSFTHADSLIQSYGGSRSYMGTNPICMTVPCKDEEPFCLDMATSMVTWNKILQYRETGQTLPPGWAVDAAGQPVRDPNKATALQPIGDYKGFGLAMMVEILCGLLTGMPFGRHLTSMYVTPIHEKRFLGHFYMAFKIDSFQDSEWFRERMQQLMTEVRNEPAADPDRPVMVPGDPEKKMAGQRSRTGIPVAKYLWDQFLSYSREHDIPLRSVDD